MYNPLCKSFDDGGFPNTGFSDQYRIILAPATEDLQDTLNLIGSIDEIGRLYGQAEQSRQRLAGTARQTKPRQHRALRIELGRTIITISRKIRGLALSSYVRRQLIGKLRSAVEEFKALEREMKILFCMKCTGDNSNNHLRSWDVWNVSLMQTELS